MLYREMAQSNPPSPQIPDRLEQLHLRHDGAVPSDELAGARAGGAARHAALMADAQRRFYDSLARHVVAALARRRAATGDASRLAGDPHIRALGDDLSFYRREGSKAIIRRQGSRRRSPS